MHAIWNLILKSYYVRSAVDGTPLGSEQDILEVQLNVVLYVRHGVCRSFQSDGREGRSNVSLGTSTKNIFEAPVVLARAVLPSRLVLHQLINCHAIIPQLRFVPGLSPLLLALWVFLFAEQTPLLQLSAVVYSLRTSHGAATLVYVTRTSWPYPDPESCVRDSERQGQAPQSERFSCEITSIY